MQDLAVPRAQDVAFDAEEAGAFSPWHDEILSISARLPAVVNFLRKIRPAG